MIGEGGVMDRCVIFTGWGPCGAPATREVKDAISVERVMVCDRHYAELYPARED